MGFLGTLFGSKQPTPAAPKQASPAAPIKPVPPVPAELPKITAPTAGQIPQIAQTSPGAQKILAANPQQTPSQYLATLQEKQMGDDMVKTLANGMPDLEGVHWAAQSAGKVSDKLPPQELHGMKSAQAWASNPTPANQSAAAAAAEQGGCRGPGSMAAQGAAWAQPATPAAPDGAAGPRLAPHAVSGSVLMSSGLQAHPAAAVPAMTAPPTSAPALVAAAPQAAQPPPELPPEVRAQTFQQQQPFIKMGLDIASGKTPVG